MIHSFEEFLNEGRVPTDRVVLGYEDLTVPQKIKVEILKRSIIPWNARLVADRFICESEPLHDTRYKAIKFSSISVRTLSRIPKRLELVGSG